jgi:hypothetical protein
MFNSIFKNTGNQGRIYARAKVARAQGGKFPGVAYLKKSKLKYGMREKKGCPRERNLREIFSENTMMFCLLSVFCVVFVFFHYYFCEPPGGGGARPRRMFLGPGA